jgi:hypothetical protein
MGLLDSFKEWWQKTSGGKADSHDAEAEQKPDTGTAPIAEAGSGSGAEFGGLGDKLDAQAGEVGQKPDPGDEGGAA